MEQFEYIQIQHKRPAPEEFERARITNSKRSKVRGDRPWKSVQHAYAQDWDEAVDEWYPELLKRSYFVPSLYMNRVHHETKQLAGTDISITRSPVSEMPRGAPPSLQECQYRDDQTQQRIIHCLKKLSERRQEIMVVIQGLQFTDYLSDAPDFCTYPLPTDFEDRNMHRGDFDLLIIHRFYGVFVAEIKIVGDIFDSIPKTDVEKEKIVRKKIKDEIKQLNKEKAMLNHLLSDLECPPRICKVMMMPNLSRNYLQNIVNSCSEIREELCLSLDGVKGHSDPLDLCLCADDLSDINSPFDITPDVMMNLSQWWEHTLWGAGEDPCMTDELYRELVTRFAGPATKIKSGLHTEWEAVSVTGDTFAMNVLNSEQEQVLDSAEPLVFITGPPGTGKTLALTLKGKDWSCRKGVHLLSTWSGSIAATLSIHHAIQEMNNRSGHVGSISMHHFDLKEGGELEGAVSCLVKAAGENQELFVIADEAYSGSEFEDLCAQLWSRVPKLRLWSASIYHGYRPRCLKEVIFREPLRTPPAVTTEVQQSQVIEDGIVRPYRPRTTPAPNWGSSPIRLNHAGPGHVFGHGPADCPECGINLAKELKKLNVGGTELPGLGKTSTAVTTTTGQEAASLLATCGPCIQPKPLKYGDVFILTIQTSFDDLRDEVCDDEGNVERAASGMIQGLRSAQVPVLVVERGDTVTIAKVVEKTEMDKVVAADADTIRGLERKVVVWVQADKGGKSSGEEDFGRLDAMSRTNAQLVIVC